MNKLEQIVYGFVKKNQPLKNMLVYFYQLAFIPQSFFKSKLKTKLPYSVVDGFFGFHDRPSCSEGNVLSHKELGSFNDFGEGSSEIIITNINRRYEEKLSATKCSNYQQGSMLTWFDSKHVIFNDFVSGKIVTRVIDLKGQEVNTFPFHFFSFNKNKKLLTTLNFHRFGTGLKGYGYDIDWPSDVVIDAKKERSELDGLKIYCIEKSEFLAEIYPSDVLPFIKRDFSGYEYFSHSHFNDEGDKLYFLYRSHNGLRNISELFVYDLGAKNLTHIPTGGMVSHLDWLNKDKIIAYCNNEAGVDGYYIIDTLTGTQSPVGDHKLSQDGHPHTLSEGCYLTDTYPNRKRYQTLFYCNAHSNVVTPILEAYSPLKYRSYFRSDFHPRKSLCSEYITLDTTFTGKRKQLVLSMKSIREEFIE